MANFFIRRPIFAWVLAIILMMAGALAILQLPVAQYPTIAPPAVSVRIDIVKFINNYISVNCISIFIMTWYLSFIIRV